MPRVTHVINVAEIPGRAPFAGAEHHLFGLMAEQVKRGLRVEFAPLIFRDGARLQKQCQKLRRAGIAVAPVIVNRPYNRRANLGLLPRLVPFFRTRRPRIVHTHLDIADSVGRLAAHVAGCRQLISTIHNNEPRYQRRLDQLKLRFLDRFNRHYIAITQLIRRYLIETIGLPTEKITTVYYGIAPPQQLLTRTEARQQLGLADNRYTIGFVGRLEAQKNPRLILEALASRSDCQAVFIGAGSLAGSLQQRARELSIPTIFTDFREDAADLMPAFDLLCLPSRWEGLGLVLLEAMVRRVPIIGSAAGAIPEILDHGRCGILFPSGNAAALRARLDTARASPQILQDMAARAETWARQRFSVKAMVDQTLAVYRDLTDL